MDKLLSVIIPAFNEELMIKKTAAVIHSILKNAGINHELIFVDDGSKDTTWKEIKAAHSKCVNVRGISFSRNFGKESAITAGLEQARGDCAVVIDCDLQHPPEKIVEMYSLWTQGYEVVEAVKSSRGKESFLHALFAKCFYGIISAATHIDMSSASDFKLLDRKAIDALLKIKENNSFFRALSSWIGFRTVQIPFEVQQRAEGESKWSTAALFKYAISNITSFYDFPVHWISAAGGISVFASIVILITVIVKRIAGYAISDFSILIIAILLIGGIIMLALGIIGYYISKIYSEIKGRPKYILSDTCGEDKQC